MFPWAAVLYGLDTLTVVGIAFAAFVIGALLTGALWFIYSRTGTARPGRACRVLWATAQGREGKGPASACPGLFIFLLSSYSGVFQQLLPWAAITYQLSDTRPSLKGDVMYYGIKFAWIILNTGLENSPGTWVKLSISGLCIIISNISVFQI